MTYKVAIRRISLASVLLVACLLPLVAQRGPGGPNAAPGGSSVSVQASADEARDLTWLREEEKLARDVYSALFAKYGIVAFDRIAASEERHFSAVGRLLATYGLPDPAQSSAPGVFTEPKLASLYADLMAKAQLSVKDALEVGVLIEKTDIADLEKAIGATNKFDIRRVYTNLLNGSYNHLDAFEGLLAVTGQ